MEQVAGPQSVKALVGGYENRQKLAFGRKWLFHSLETYSQPAKRQRTSHTCSSKVNSSRQHVKDALSNGQQTTLLKV